MQYAIQVWSLTDEPVQTYGNRAKKRGLIGTECEWCGYEKHATRHRIKPGSEGGRYILGNVVGLCPNHHWEADNALIPRAILFQIVHQRLRAQNGKVQE